MKLTLRINLLILAVMLGFSATAQRVKAFAGFGGAAYYGDLVQGSPLLKQIKPSFSFGGSYDIMMQLRARASFTFTQIGANDKDNNHINYRERNLSFKSNIFEFSTLLEYDFLNNYGETGEFRFTPYVFAGPGVMSFNPTTIDRNGNKVDLQPLGTEGQGIEGYGKKYSKTAFNFGFGGGIRYDLTDLLAIGGEVYFRRAFTDYLDDVSTSYVDPLVFRAAYGETQGDYISSLSYRGDEVGKAFGVKRPRGSSKNNDWFYTFQLTLVFKLEAISWGGDLDFFNSNRGYGPKRSMRNPKSVL